MKHVLRQSTFALTLCLLSHSSMQANDIMTSGDDSVTSRYARHQADGQTSKQTIQFVADVVNDNNLPKPQKAQNKSKRSRTMQVKQTLEDIGSIFLLGLQEWSYTFGPMLGVPVKKIYKQ